MSILINEGFRMYRRLRRVKKQGFRRHTGDDLEICKRIIDSCWNGKEEYFRVSGGHFDAFYCRDFSWVAGSLIHLGYREKVRKTLDYALGRFREHGRIRVAIDNKGRPFDFPTEAIDSVPSIVRSLRTLGDEAVIKRHKAFVEEEAMRLFRTCFDKDSGLVRSDRQYSSIRDHSKRNGTCYDNCMLAMLSSDLDMLRLGNPFQRYNLKEEVMKTFWNGKYFKETANSDGVSAEALVFPFWCGLTKHTGHFRSVMNIIKKEGLDSPLPLRYQSHRDGKMNLYSLLAKDYETDSCWAHVGLIYIGLLARHDHGEARRALKMYEEKILEHGNFLEVYSREGKPFSGTFYISDESMVWCAMYMEEKKRLMP